jgi:hypothetical protein
MRWAEKQDDSKGGSRKQREPAAEKEGDEGDRDREACPESDVAQHGCVVRGLTFELSCLRRHAL